MTKPLVVGADARAEIVEAELFYEAERAGLGQRFHSAVVATLAEIEKFPSSAKIVRGPRSEYVVRGARVPGFPYRVIYVELPDRLLALAVVHLKRRPGSWWDRLK